MWILGLLVGAIALYGLWILLKEVLTPEGEWVRKESKDHMCQYPNPNTTKLGDGSVWRCRCGRRWKLTTYGPDTFFVPAQEIAATSNKRH